MATIKLDHKDGHPEVVSDCYWRIGPEPEDAVVPAGVDRAQTQGTLVLYGYADGEHTERIVELRTLAGFSVAWSKVACTT